MNEGVDVLCGHRNKRRGRRGFFFSYDALVAGAIFTLFLAIIFTYWSSMRGTLFARIDEMLRTALSASEILLSQGSPANWTAQSWEQVGLVDVPRSVRINKTKLDNFKMLTAQNYNEVRKRIAPGYEFAVTVGNVNVGHFPEGHEREKVSITRAVIYNGMPVNMTIIIWVR